jgi:hypothetical protein
MVQAQEGAVRPFFKQKKYNKKMDRQRNKKLANRKFVARLI